VCEVEWAKVRRMNQTKVKEKEKEKELTAVLLGNILRGDAHGDQAVSGKGGLRHLVGELISALAPSLGHRLNSSSNSNVNVPGLDRTHNVGARLKSGGALAVHSGHGGLNGKSNRGGTKTRTVNTTKIHWEEEEKQQQQ